MANKQKSNFLTDVVTCNKEENSCILYSSEFKKTQGRQRSLSYRIGNFQLISLLDSGFFGHAVIAEALMNGIKLKVILKFQNKRWESIASIYMEIANLRKISAHKKCNFVVQFLGCFQTTGHSLLVLEYLENLSLKANLIQSGNFDEITSKFYTACIFSALQDIHSLNIVHNDLKLQNIALGKDGYPKLVDFGNSLNISAEDRYSDFLKDYINLGKCLYEMLTGEPLRKLPLDEASSDMLLNVPYSYLDFIRKLTDVSCLGETAENIREFSSSLHETPFIKNYNWDALLKKEVKPPLFQNQMKCSCLDNQSAAWIWEKIKMSKSGPILIDECDEVPFIKCWIY